VGVGGARIEPQPLSAIHATNHIPIATTKNILEYNGLQNGGATTRQPQNSTYKNSMPLGHEVMHKLGRIPLFEGSILTSLSSTLLILNCCKTHGVTNVFVNELLGLLKQNVFPQPNTLLATKHGASNVLNRLELAYNVIHACVKGCMLFHGFHENVDHCVKCGETRYKVHGKFVIE
jgi:hypothetical protein